MWHSAGVKMTAAKLIAASIAVEQAGEAGGFMIDGGHIVSIALAGLCGLIAALISAAWKDMRQKHSEDVAVMREWRAEAKREREDLRQQVAELQTFRIRAGWVCPLLDPHATTDQQRDHLREHLRRLDAKED